MANRLPERFDCTLSNIEESFKVLNYALNHDPMKVEDPELRVLVDLNNTDTFKFYDLDDLSEFRYQFNRICI